nr:heat shock 70 kDa protein [Ipomoea batatas]
MNTAEEQPLATIQPHEGGVVGSSTLALPSNQLENPGHNDLGPKIIQRKEESSTSCSLFPHENKIKASERSPNVHDNLERSTKKTKRLNDPPEVEIMQGVETTSTEETNNNGRGDVVRGDIDKTSYLTGGSASNTSKELIRLEIFDSYGPWMIAKRRERRQNHFQGRKEGRQIGAENQGSNGQENMRPSGGSQFKALQEDDQDEINCVKEDNTMYEPKLSPENTRGNVQPNYSKGKRPSVQVNEKQILNEKAEKYSGHTNKVANTSRGEKSSYSKKGQGGNKAGAAERHTVVRGEKFGMISVATVVDNESKTQRQEGLNEMAFLEHHDDPPIANEEEIEVVFEKKDSVGDKWVSKKDHADKIRWIYTQATETRNAFRNTAILNQNNASSSTINITWKQPPDGWYVLNTDGSFGNGAANGSCAGVVRDSRDSWCGDFGFKVPATTVAMTEVWAILKGVEWAWRKGFRKLIVQSDSKKIIDWIEDTNKPRGPMCNIIERLPLSQRSVLVLITDEEDDEKNVGGKDLFHYFHDCEGDGRRRNSEEMEPEVEGGWRWKTNEVEGHRKRTGSEEMELEDEVRGGGGRGCDKRKMKWSRRTRLEKAETELKEKKVIDDKISCKGVSPTCAMLLEIIRNNDREISSVLYSSSSLLSEIAFPKLEAMAVDVSPICHQGRAKQNQ